MDDAKRTFELLTSLYGKQDAKLAHDRINALIDQFRLQRKTVTQTGGSGISHADAFLITYGDQVQEPGTTPLRCLADFCKNYLANIITAVHILPFFPYSSDDGFSVIDYRNVDPMLGSWKDVAQMGSNFRLMFDAVLNHVSVRHKWFQSFLQDDPRYRNYFVVVEGTPDLSHVVRPRTLPLLTEIQVSTASRRLWTTFSEDQIDLNFRHIDVLLEILDLLLFYISRGAGFLRLDAVAYLWKEIGTSCIHLPQTHAIIKLFRAVLDQAAPDVQLITETNVPHAENISYFGDGTDEAQMVYNFALPPLLLHTIQTRNSRALTHWAASLKLPSNRTTFFNFLASHDGIGINPVRGILTETEIDAVVKRCMRHGGLVSYKRKPDGTDIPYELNINYFDALSDPHTAEDLNLQADRFSAAHTILLSLIGVPAIYFHSLFGSRSWVEGPVETGRNRTINRQKLIRQKVEQDLADSKSLRHKVFTRLRALLQVRSQHPAFHPYGKQEVLECGDSVFSLIRSSPQSGERILCLQNITPVSQNVLLPQSARGINLFKPTRRISAGSIQLSPYEGMWIQLS
ncbi:sugar phosphorylase [bacterium]|nr:sugar phosphorylase [bacterium]